MSLGGKSAVTMIGLISSPANTVLSKSRQARQNTDSLKRFQAGCGRKFLRETVTLARCAELGPVTKCLMAAQRAFIQDI